MVKFAQVVGVFPGPRFDDAEGAEAGEADVELLGWEAVAGAVGRCLLGNLIFNSSLKSWNLGVEMPWLIYLLDFFKMEGHRGLPKCPGWQTSIWSSTSISRPSKFDHPCKLKLLVK